jgi:protein-disulfide isomerase
MSPAHHAPPVGPDDHVSGPDDAPITLIEYGDFECSYCGLAYPILKRVQQALGPRLRFVFRHFPLAQAHPHAELAAQAAEAASAQGMFWEMHDMLYENQDRLDAPDILRYAEALDLDVNRFAEDWASPAVAQRVRHDFSGGVRSGVNGTPTFFVNGVRFDGDWRDAQGFVDALATSVVR